MRDRGHREQSVRQKERKAVQSVRKEGCMGSSLEIRGHGEQSMRHRIHGEQSVREKGSIGSSL